MDKSAIVTVFVKDDVLEVWIKLRSIDFLMDFPAFLFLSRSNEIMPAVAMINMKETTSMPSDHPSWAPTVFRDSSTSNMDVTEQTPTTKIKPTPY